MSSPDVTLWIPEEPIKYTFAPKPADDIFARGVVIRRMADHEDNVAVAVMELRRERDTMRLVQIDGDLNPSEMDKDEEIIRDYRRYEHKPHKGVWESAWKVVMP